MTAAACPACGGTEFERLEVGVGRNALGYQCVKCWHIIRSSVADTSSSSALSVAELCRIKQVESSAVAIPAIAPDVRLVLPYPPVGANNQYASTGKGRRVLMVAARAWRDEVIVIARQSGQTVPAGPLALRLWVYPPNTKRRRDL